MRTLRVKGCRADRSLIWGCVLCVVICGLSLASCSVPNLEKPECTAARDAVRRFYSLHFANDLHPSADYLKAREPLITTELFRTLSASNETSIDYFTQTDDYPRAFRVGACEVDSGEMTHLEVDLLWRDETRTEQREVSVEAVKSGDKWLINKVSK
jgi:hypothetical protein